MKRLVKKALAALLAAAVVFQAMPMTQLGSMVRDAHAESEALKDELAAREADYPEGAFAFYSTSSESVEGNSDITVKVVRLGDTSGAASVDVKAADITAKYGEDYTAYVKDGLNKLPFEQTDKEQTSLQAADEATDIDTQEAEETPQSQESGGLRAAYMQQTGEETVSTNWRGELIDYAAREMSVQAENEIINAVDGACFTLDFEEGEFEKNVFIHIEDDGKAESEESFALLLGNSSTGRLGEQMQYNVTVSDNEQPQEVMFAMKDSDITLSEGDTSVTVTVTRTQGLDYYAGAVLQTVADTALPQKDYEPLDSVEVAFLPGETEKSVDIPILSDVGESKKFSVKITGENTQQGKDTTDIYFGSKIFAPLVAANVQTEDIMEKIQQPIAFADKPMTISSVETVSGVKYDVYPVDISNNPLRAYTHDSVKLDQTGQSSKVNYNIGYAAKLKIYTKLSGNSRNWFFGYHYYYGKTGTLYLDGVKMLENKTADKKSEETKYFTTMKDVTYRQSTINSVFQVKANTDGLCRTAQFDMTRYDSYVPYFTITLQNVNPSLTAYDYTAPNKKTSRSVNALSKVSLKEGTKKELSFKAGSVNLTPGQTINGVSLTGFDVYVGSQKIGTINSTGVINYVTVSKLREKYDQQIRSANYKLTFKPIYSVASSKVTFDSQDQSAIGFGDYKFGSKNAVTVRQIDTISVTARRVGTQEFSPQSIKLFKVEKGRETQLDSKSNTKDQKTGAYPTSMTYKFTASQPEMLVRAYLTEPTLTIRYDPDYDKAANSGVGMVLLSALNDPTNYIGISAVGAPLKLPDKNNMYGFAGLGNTYLLTTAINDAYIHMENTAGGITTYSSTYTNWTYRDQNKGGIYQTVTGDSFAFKPYYADTVIDYFFEFRQEPAHTEGISGNVTLQEVPLFTSYTKPQTFPAVGVQITAGNATVLTDKDGNYTIEPQFAAGSVVGAFMKLDTLTRADTIAISRNTRKDMTIVVNDDDPLKIISSQMTVFKKQDARDMNNNDVYIETPMEVMTLEDAVYHLKMTAAGSAGVVPDKAVVNVYDKYGKLRSDVQIEGKFDDDYTIDIPVDPVRDGLQVGDTIAIKIYDKNGVGYFERHTRLVVAEKLSGAYMFNYTAYSMEDDNAFLKALGNISIGYDYMIDAVANEHGQAVDAEGKYHNMMYIGFGDNGADADTIYANEQEIINNFGNLEKGTYGLAADRIPVFGSDNGAFSLSISAGAIMDCVLQENGKYTFGDFVLIGEAAGEIDHQWKVPLGPITLAFTIHVYSSDVNTDKATGIRWRFYNDSDTPFYISENSTLDLMTRKEIKSQGDMTVYLYARGDVDVGVLDGLLSVGGRLDVTLDHHTLYSTDDGWTNKGYISLKPNVHIKVLIATIPVWEDEWQYTYGDSKAAKSISMQMEEQVNNSILFAPTAISNISEFEKAQETQFDTMPTSLAVDSSSTLVQSVLKDSVAENADVKMQDLGGGKYLTVFIDAVPGRSAENALGAYYTVFDGEKWSTPKLLEDDGTIDQLPTICNAGSKGWLIAWSDASRKLEKDEALTSSLNALDLTGRFYNADTDTLGEVMSLTRETKEDTAADTSPQIVYYKDETTGKEHMRLYYTKSEFEISDPEEGEVVGDILNPYQLIAVRNYDFAQDKWSEEYSGTAKDEILENVGELQFAQYVENWYGQEFLQLAPTVEMTEELDDNGYWKEGTQPTFTEKDMSQTVVKGGDSIAYNHLSLFAYALDKGGMSQQTGDMNLYMQIYNMQDDEYHHPIQITSKNAEISDIRFERLKIADGIEITYLYWLEDGVVKRINITDLVANDHLIKTEAAGVEYYYIDKSYTEPSAEDETDENYEPEYVVASAYVEETDADIDDEAQPLSISSYKVKQKDGRNYIVWTQFVPRGEGDEAKSELQLFAATEDMTKGERSMPVQLTDEKDLYISRFDCAVADNGSLDVTAVCQTLDENGKPKADSAQLKRMHIVPADKPQLTAAELDDVVISEDGIEVAEFIVDAANKGLSSKDDLSIEIHDASGNVTSTTLAPMITYDTTEIEQDDGSVMLAETEIVTDVPPITLAGGESYTAKLSLPLNEDGSYEGTVNLLSGNTVIDTIKLSGKASAELAFEDLTAEVASRGKVTLTANISNNSILDSGEQNIVYGYIDENGERAWLGTENLSSLAYGESSEVSVTADIDFDKFVSVTNEDGSVTDSMTFYMDTDADNTTGSYATLELYATADEVSFMNSLKELSAQPCEIGADGSITLAKEVSVGDYLNMQLLVGGEIAANNEEYVNRTKIVWVSVEGEAVTLDENGLPVAAANGKATLKGFVVPYDMESVMYADGITDNINNYDVKPSAVLIPIEASVTVGKEAQISGDNDDDTEDKEDNTDKNDKPDNDEKNNEDTQKPSDNSTPTKPGAQGSTNSPATGDTTAAIAILGAAALAAVMFSRKRNGKEDTDNSEGGEE